jgi:archaeal flagellar protein FlaI
MSSDEVASKIRSLAAPAASKKKAPEKAQHPPTGKKPPPNFVTVDRYPLQVPFSYANIAEAPTSKSKVYFLDEVGLTGQEVEVYRYLLDAMENELTISRKKVDPKAYFESQAKRVAMKYSLKMPRLSWSKIYYYAERDIVGFGVLDGIMRDPNIEDVSVDGVHRPVLVYHRKYERIPTNIVFDDDATLNDLIARFAHIAGKHISVAFPIMQGILPGGHRVMATFRKEVSPRGGTMSIRKFREDPITIVDMLNFGVLDHTAAAYVWFLMENRSTAIVVGATGSGKTTMMNALLTLTPTNSKIITIEEVQEVNLTHQGWTALVSREAYGVTEEGPKGVDLFDLVKAAMRMRPDILVVGEVRGEEAYVLFQAISTGHGGLCTLHADDTPSAIQRLISKPMDVPPAFIPFVDIAITVRRLTIQQPGGGFKVVRRIISIDEVRAVGDYVTMFSLDPAKDKLVAKPLRNSFRLQKLAQDLGISMQDVEEEIKMRGAVLEWMRSKGLRNFREITPIFQAYVDDPKATYARAMAELQAPPVPKAGSGDAGAEKVSGP